MNIETKHSKQLDPRSSRTPPPEEKQENLNRNSPKVSPRDVKKDPFENNKTKKQNDDGASHHDQDVHNEPNQVKNHSHEPSLNPASECNQAKRLKLTTQPISNSVSAAEQTSSKGNEKEVKRKTNEDAAKPEDPPKHMTQHEASPNMQVDAYKKSQGSEYSAPEAMEVDTITPVPLAITSPTRASASPPQHAQKSPFNVRVHIASAPQPVAGVNEEITPKETDGNATSSSSSSSKPSNRPRRVSLAYLQRTRVQRRAIARARAQRREVLKEEEIEKERMMKLQDLGEDERQKYIRMIETERQKREAARRREVKRVKNRESVEKSRVRELVLENEVENEGDVLRWENARMAGFLEYVKREKVVKQVKKEVATFNRKRKRDKEGQ